MHEISGSVSRLFAYLFDMLQHVTAVIHRCGSTLDLVMTFDGALINEVRVDPPILSDHSLVICALCVDHGQAAGWLASDGIVEFNVPLDTV